MKKFINFMKSPLRMMGFLVIALFLTVFISVGILVYKYATKPSNQEYTIEGEAKTIYIDDDACYHFTVEINDKIVGFHDECHADVFYNDTVETPLVRINFTKRYDILSEKWITRVNDFSIFLPEDYEVQMVSDGIF